MKLHFVFGEGGAEALLHFEAFGWSGSHGGLEFEPAALTRTFGVIESDIGFALKEFRRRAGPEEPDADAGADEDLVLVDFERAGERGSEFVRDSHGVGFGGEDGELIAAEARQQGARFEAGLETHAYAFQDAAAEGVAEHTVDEMETVEVDAQERRKGFTVGRRGEALGEQALEGGAGKQTGNSVMIGFPAHFGQQIMLLDGEFGEAADGVGSAVAGHSGIEADEQAEHLSDSGRELTSVEAIEGGVAGIEKNSRHILGDNSRKDGNGRSGEIAGGGQLPVLSRKKKEGELALLGFLAGLGAEGFENLTEVAVARDHFENMGRSRGQRPAGAPLGSDGHTNVRNRLGRARAGRTRQSGRFVRLRLGRSHRDVRKKRGWR